MGDFKWEALDQQQIKWTSSEFLKDIGYRGECTEEKILQETLEKGPKYEGYRKLITWIINEIAAIKGSSETIDKDSNFEDFMLELSGLLKELFCPYDCLISGPLENRLDSKNNCFLLFDFLTTQLALAKIEHKSKENEVNVEEIEIPSFQNPVAQNIKDILAELNIVQNPSTELEPKALFGKVHQKLEETMKAKQIKLPEPLFSPKTKLTDNQWKLLEEKQKEFDVEFNLRRKMLLTRLDCTVQSFKWQEGNKANLEKEITEKYQETQEELTKYNKCGTDADIAALLAARTDIAIEEKTSSSSVRKNTACKIQKHVIGKVPDRGGRADEQAPPPPEMPSWQQNRSTGPKQQQWSGKAGSSGSGGNWNQQGQGNQNNYGQKQHQRQQYDNRQQHEQRQPIDQYQQYDQRQQFDQRQQYDNRQQYDQRQGQWQQNPNASTRVQGGWSQRGGESGFQQNYGNTGGNSYYNSNQGDNYNQKRGGGRGGYHRGGGGSSYRGSGDRR